MGFPQEDTWLFGIVFLYRQEWEKDELDGLFGTFPQYTQALLVLLLLNLLFLLFLSFLRFAQQTENGKRRDSGMLTCRQKKSERYERILQRT